MARPIAETPRGGQEFGFDGSTSGKSLTPGTQQQTDPFTGLGPFLEEPDAEVFKQLNALVLRTELVAKNHLHQDTHWQLVKRGYPWSTLEKEPNRSTYKQFLPYGSAAISIQPVPNKSWDLINKTTEALLVDFPQAECQPIDDSEEADNACKMANRFLAQNATERGTNDAVLWNNRVNASLTRASTYIEYWVDPTGGGSVPLKIKAHPQAQSPQNPLVGPDGMPTTDYVMRYVTKGPGPDGQLPPDAQFTDDPSQAAPQWEPKIRATKWNREHVRCFPETADANDAQKILILGFCTLDEAKRRWKSIRQMAPEDLSALCDWTPPRYLTLLPSFLKARWKLTDTGDKKQTGSSDERIMFYYSIRCRKSPDYPKGAYVTATGALDGFVIDRKLLSATVAVTKRGQKTQEVRALEPQVVQIRPVDDPDDDDPTGTAFIERFAGAAENTAHLAMGFSEAVDKILHRPFAINSTSPIEGYQVQDAEQTGDFLLIQTPGDVPIQLPPPALPEAFFNLYELSDNAINSMASQNRPAQGSDQQQEVSGVARQIAVSQNNVSLSGMNTAVNNAYARANRIVIELAMTEFTTTQQIQYVGEDGAYKQDEWTGVDFSLVGQVAIKAGTGTLIPPDQKIQYLANLTTAGLLTHDEAMDAARESYQRRLGLGEDPHTQYIERCVDQWLQGPPQGEPPSPGNPQGKPGWIDLFKQWQQAMAAYQVQVAPLQQAYQVQAQQAQLRGMPAPPPPQLPPQPPKPWSPFQPRPNDQELPIAQMWAYRLSRLMSTVKYRQFGPEWGSLVDGQYQMAEQVIQRAQQAQLQAQMMSHQKPPQPPKPQPPGNPRSTHKAVNAGPPKPQPPPSAPTG